MSILAWEPTLILLKKLQLMRRYWKQSARTRQLWEDAPGCGCNPSFCFININAQSSVTWVYNSMHLQMLYVSQSSHGLSLWIGDRLELAYNDNFTLFKWHHVISGKIYWILLLCSHIFTKQNWPVIASLLENDASPCYTWVKFLEFAGKTDKGRPSNTVFAITSTIKWVKFSRKRLYAAKLMSVIRINTKMLWRYLKHL